MTRTSARRPWYRPMVARHPDEPHRVSTPLFFDLCFVVAVAQAAGGLARRRLPRAVGGRRRRGDRETHHAHVSRVAVGYAVAVPVAVYLFSVWLLHVRPHQRGPILAAYPATAALVLLAPLTPAPAIALLAAALVAVTVVAAHRAPARS